MEHNVQKNYGVNSTRANVRIGKIVDATKMVVNNCNVLFEQRIQIRHFLGSKRVMEEGISARNVAAAASAGLGASAMGHA